MQTQDPTKIMPEVSGLESASAAEISIKVKMLLSSFCPSIQQKYSPSIMTNDIASAGIKARVIVNFFWPLLLTKDLISYI